MRVAALSDFHIGVRGYTDGFSHDLPAFGRFLDTLERDHERIVLLGDIWQTDHATVPSRAAAARHLRAARARLPGLSQRLSEPPYVYVYGNHDLIAESELGAVPHVCLGGALFIHGHQFDPVATAAPWAAVAGTWTTGQLRKTGMRSFASWLEGRDITIKDRRFRGRQGPYARASRQLAAEHDAHCVVMGHTHVASRTPLGDGVVALNTGSCSRGQRNFVSIDTETLVSHVFDGKRPL